MNPYQTCLYTIRNKMQLDDAAEKGTRFAFTINMSWTGASAEFEKNGNLNCEICGFSFEAVYDQPGKDFCEVHHIRVLSESNEGEPTTTLDDLSVLCSNCHRVIHRKKPAYTIDEIKSFMEKNTAN